MGSGHSVIFFTARQLVALTTFSDLGIEARQHAIADGASAERADAIATYLAIALSRLSDSCNALCTWSHGRQTRAFTYSLVRRYRWCGTTPKPTCLPNAAGDYVVSLNTLLKVLESAPARGRGTVRQLDATALTCPESVVSTDPPYYDNIGYADLSDFFYVWLRRSLSPLYPDLFQHPARPEETGTGCNSLSFRREQGTSATVLRRGLRQGFCGMRTVAVAKLPTHRLLRVQADGVGRGRRSRPRRRGVYWLGDYARRPSSGWLPNQQPLGPCVANDRAAASAWARTRLPPRSSSPAVPGPDSAPITTRKDFLASLKKELPHALRNLQKGNIAPVDLAQAAIGPGMAVFSRYKKVLETDGSPMRVRTALALINQGLDEVLSELESEFDPDTRWALAWFEQHQFDEGALW